MEIVRPCQSFTDQVWLQGSLIFCVEYPLDLVHLSSIVHSIGFSGLMWCESGCLHCNCNCSHCSVFFSDGWKWCNYIVGVS